MAADLTGEVCERGRVVGTKERERENEENMSLYILYDSLCERVIESVIDRERVSKSLRKRQIKGKRETEQSLERERERERGRLRNVSLKCRK